MDALATALKRNEAETQALIAAAPDWAIAERAFDDLFKRMSDPGDALWSAAFIDELQRAYLDARDNDKACANITVRTVNAMPQSRSADTKKVLLLIANACRIFNAAHKVNFEDAELPQDFAEVPMTASKKKGSFTFAEDMPSLYPKTSLTFDYWVPKILEITREVREKKITDWKHDATLAVESCTDFIRICLIFLSDPATKVPIAKAEDRESMLKLLGYEFTWIKKSAKREDIKANSMKLKEGLERSSRDAGIDIPLEAWSRLQQAPFIKPLIK